ncbi:MAG: mechanosensitive ion channel family protein, partial [Deltaproteobacteria bacterium]|nr:mechanosensitive ion channel family protein [Nannocystaceae bacterium]
PRAAVTTFLEHCRAQRYDEAAASLDIPRDDTDRAGELARRLAAVLNRYVVADLEALSGESAGDLDDGLRKNLEDIGKVAVPEGAAEPIRMMRRGKPAAWVFARSSVARIDDWYARLPNRWLLDHLPKSLQRPGPLELPYWQWLAMPASLVLAWMLGWALGRVTRALVRRVLQRTAPRWDPRLLARLHAPLVLGWTLVAWRPMSGWLGFEPGSADWVLRLDRAGLLLALFWILLRVGDIGGELVTESRWSLERPSSRSLVRLGTRVAKVAIVAIAIIAFFSELGFAVTSLIAGLGIGGLALALAAQKTVENLFGAFSLGADQPFREGDYVRVDDFTGTVETIGLRSTRFRTPDRTMITIPNGKLAEARLETFAARDRIRLNTVVRLGLDSKVEAVRALVLAIEAVLRAHPRVWSDNMTVAVLGFGEWSLDVEVVAWFQVDDVDDFPGVRQEVLLQILEAVEASGCALAVPVRSVELHDARAPG